MAHMDLTMVVKKRNMHSPTQEDSFSDTVLPLHDKGLLELPLHLRVEPSSDVEDSPKRFNASERLVKWGNNNDALLPQWIPQTRPPSPAETSSSSTCSSSSGSGMIQPAQEKERAPYFLLALLLVAMTAIYTSRSTLAEAQQQVPVLMLNKDIMNKQLSKTEKEFLHLRREISAMDMMMQKEQASIHTTGALSRRMLEDVQEMQDRVKQLKNSVTLHKEKVQALGKKEVLEKYGASPRRVEIELVFPDRQLGPHRFVIEMAPLDIMPHSVHTFLEMVDAGLLDGCSFILNALHVVKAAPLPYDGTSAAEKAKAFTSHGLESVSFKEYSELFPHEQFTVGFAADGSPSFYINTEDNSEIHVGDPCFGKVVEGVDAIKRLEAQPTRNGIWFEKRIGIRSARLLPN